MNVKYKVEWILVWCLSQNHLIHHLILFYSVVCSCLCKELFKVQLIDPATPLFQAGCSFGFRRWDEAWKQLSLSGLCTEVLRQQAQASCRHGSTFMPPQATHTQHTADKYPIEMAVENPYFHTQLQPQTSDGDRYWFRATFSFGWL